MRNKNLKEIREFLISRKEIIILILILIFAFFLRIHALGVPPLWIDEAISVNTANNILEKGFPIFDSGINNKTYFLHYSIALFLFIANNEFFARFVSVIFGLLTIILAYKIGKEYSNSAGLIAAIFFSVFYLEIFFSRQSRYYQLLQLCFFACIYFLYKSKENPKYLILSIITFFIALDTHLQALILAPFMILHILIYNRKQWFLSIFPLIPFLNKFRRVPSVTSSGKTQEIAINYASKYFSYASNMIYLLILFVPGVILGFIKKKRLTILILAPSIITLLGIFTVKIFAFRYSYFFVFPLLLYVSILFGWLYNKYGRIILIPILILIIIPSNLFYPYTYINVIKPIDTQFLDPSAPYTDYKKVPYELKENMKENILISYFSPDVEYYIKKPNYVIPFSMSGIGKDSVSINNSENKLVDRYSGAEIIQNIPLEDYYITLDKFSVSKLKIEQREFLGELINNCTSVYYNYDLQIFYCDKKI